MCVSLLSSLATWPSLPLDCSFRLGISRMVHLNIGVKPGLEPQRYCFGEEPENLNQNCGGERWMRGRFSQIRKESSSLHKRISLSVRVKRVCSWKIFSWNAAKNSKLMRCRCSHMHTFLSQASSCSLDKISVAASSRTVNKGHRFVSGPKGKQKVLFVFHPPVPSAQPFADSGGSQKTGGSQAWKRLWLYNYHRAWKTDPEQMQNRTRGRRKREHEQQSPPRVLWWPELMGFKSKSLINPQCFRNKPERITE